MGGKRLGSGPLLRLRGSFSSTPANSPADSPSGSRPAHASDGLIRRIRFYRSVEEGGEGEEKEREGFAVVLF